MTFWQIIVCQCILIKTCAYWCTYCLFLQWENLLRYECLNVKSINVFMNMLHTISSLIHFVTFIRLFCFATYIAWPDSVYLSQGWKRSKEHNSVCLRCTRGFAKMSWDFDWGRFWVKPPQKKIIRPVLPNIQSLCWVATIFSCQYNSVLLQKAKNTLICALSSLYAPQ